MARIHTQQLSFDIEAADLLLKGKSSLNLCYYLTSPTSTLGDVAVDILSGKCKTICKLLNSKSETLQLNRSQVHLLKIESNRAAWLAGLRVQTVSLVEWSQ